MSDCAKDVSVAIVEKRYQRYTFKSKVTTFANVNTWEKIISSKSQRETTSEKNIRNKSCRKSEVAYKLFVRFFYTINTAIGTCQNRCQKFFPNFSRLNHPSGMTKLVLKNGWSKPSNCCKLGPVSYATNLMVYSACV